MIKRLLFSIVCIIFSSCIININPGINISTSDAIPKPLEEGFVLADFETSIPPPAYGISLPESFMEKYILVTDEVYEYTFTLTITKRKENQIEGVFRKSGEGFNESFLIYGVFDEEFLYIYTRGNSGPEPNIFVHSDEIFPREVFIFKFMNNYKELKRIAYAHYEIDGQIQWIDEPPYEVNLAKNPNKEVLLYISSGFKQPEFFKDYSPENINENTLEGKLIRTKYLYEEGLYSEDDYRKKIRTLIR